MVRVMAMVADRLLHGDSKLATARHCHATTAGSSLGAVLGLEDLTEQDCYRAMDWLLERQPGIEWRLARKHLNADEPVLYDLSSSYFEGHTCPLAKHGYSRDHRGDLPQVNYGLYCAQDGTPVAVDVLPGNEGDRVAFPKAVERIQSEFGMDDDASTWLGVAGSAWGVDYLVLDSSGNGLYETESGGEYTFRVIYVVP